MALSQSALFLAIVSSTLAVPLMVSDVTSNECATACTEATKFGYEAGKTYRYVYRSEVTTHIQGANTEQSKMNVEALAHVEVLSTCEMLLKLTDVKLTDSHPERLTTKTNVERAWEFKRTLQQKPLRFAFKDGLVESVCPEPEEETWALNVKRAILSGLQNTMHDLGTHTRNKEADISGDCYVDYAVESLWTGYKITKVKDVLSCSGRAHYDPLLQTAKFNSASRVQSLPLIKTTHQCEQTISSAKIITAARCEEKHVFRPFSTDTSGATTEVSFSLQHTETVSGTSQQGTISGRKSLVFDYEPTEEQTQAENRRGVNEVKATLSTMCTQTETSVQQAAPGSFSQLVRTMRTLSAEQLEAVHRQVKASPPCARAEAFLHDAVPALGTPGSARLIRVLLTSGELTQDEADKWLTSLSFLPRPTRELLADIKGLLVQNVSFRKSTLAVTSLVNNYCRFHADCSSHREIREIISILDENLGYNCAFRTKAEYTKILTTLKGIGNAGHAERVVPKLNRCLLNFDLPAELRVAAISAFRRMACTAERDELVNMFESSRQDAELRIAAYLNLMACPTADILARVQRRLETEEVNQVGSFVWTHLTNLQTTASPLKQDIRKILENQELKKTFDLDKRKFSRNIEWSTFSDDLNAGVTVDSNLIWSPKSFVPRSAMLNLTVDMFGESLNLVEVGGRAEGTDNLLESFFGPAQENNDLPSTGRGRRNFNKPSIMDPLHDRFGLERDTPKGSYYVRMFGNEIRFDDFQEFDAGDILSKFDYSGWLETLARRHTIDYTNSGLLFDASLVVPTVAGLPLRLRADAAAVVNMKVTGKMDIRNLRAVDIEGTVRPSAAVQVNSEMSVDAVMARTGVRMENTMRSNTLLAGRLELRTGGVINLDVNMPDDNIELFDAKSKFFIDYRDVPREQAMLTTGRIEKRMCSDASLVKAFGLELCGRLSIPHAYKVSTAPWYPLTGPTSVSLVLSKKDTYRGLHFETKFAKEQVAGVTGTKDIAKISISTPGSKIDREFTFEYTLDNPKKRLNINLKTPIKTMEFEGSVQDTEGRKQVKAVGSIDSDRYDLTAQVDITKNRLNTVYKPLLEVTLPNRPAYRMRGNVIYRPGKKADVSMRMENILQGPTTVRGSVDYTKKTDTYDAILELDSASYDGKLEGSVVRPSKTGAKTDISIEYTKGSTKETARHRMEWKLKSVKPKLEFELKSDMVSSAYSQYNSDIDFTVAADKDAGQLSLVSGLTGSTKRLTLGTEYTIDLVGPSKSGEVKFNLALPYMNWDHGSEADFQLGDEFFKAKAQRRCSGYLSNLKVHVARQSTSPLKTLLEVSFDGPGRHHLLKDTLVETSTGTYDHDLVLDLSADYKIRVDSTVKRLPRPEITAQVRIPNVKPIKVDGFVNAELTDFSSSAKLMYGTDEYSTAASWKFTKAGPTLNSDASFALVYPRRTVLAKTKMTSSRRSAMSELEIKWDAKKDSSKRFMIKTELSRSSNGMTPRMNLRTEWYPSKFIDLTITGKNDKKGWYHPERDIEGKFVFLSTFENARQVSASIGHMQTSTQISTKTEVSWDTNNKINTDLTVIKRNGWQDAIITIQTSTPFERLRTAKYVHDYSIRGNTYESKNRLDWGQKFAELTMTGSGDVANHAFEGGVTLRTSYQGYNRMAMTAKHTDNGQIFNSQFQGTWRDGSTMTVAFNMNHERSGWHVTNSGDLSVTLPVGKYRNNKLVWNHRNTAALFKSRAELQLDTEKTVIDVDSTYEETSSLQMADVKISFTSPYSPLRDLAFSLNQRVNPQSPLVGMVTTTSVKWAPDRVITVTKNSDLRPGRQMKTIIVVTTPFQGYKRLSAHLEDNHIGEKYTIKREYKWGSNNKIALDGFVMLTYPETQADFRFVSPFEGAERLLLKFENKKVNGIWQTTGQFDYHNNQKIEISTQVGWERNPKFNLEVKTPFEPLQMLFVDMDHSGPADNFKTKIQVEHNLMGGRAVLTLDSDVSNLEDIKIQLGFTSPYEQVSFIKSGFSHKKTGKKYSTAYTFEYPGYKSAIINDLMLKKTTDFDEKLTLEYGSEKIETGLKFKMKPVFRFTTFLKTPYHGYRSSSFDVQFDNRVNTLLTSEMIYGNAQRIAGNLDYRNNNGRIVGRVGVETPFDGYRTTSLNFNHQGPWNNFKNGGTLVINERTYTANGEFRYRNSDIKISGSLTTPYEEYRTNSLLFEHEGEALDMKQKLEFVYGANKIEVTHEFRYRNQRLNHKLLVITPFSELSSLKAEIKHNGQLKSFRNEGTLEYNGRVFTGNSVFTYGKKAIRGSLTVNTPEVYTVSFNHKGPINDFTNNVQADLSGRSYSANSQFKMTRNAVEASTTIRSPHQRLRQLSATLNHRGPYNNFQNSFSLQANDNTYTGEAQMRVVGNEITASAEFKVPQVYGLNIAHKGGLNNFENSFDVTIDTTKYEGSSNFRNVDASIRGAASLKIPQEYSLTFAHTGSAMNFANDFSLKVDGKEASGNTRFVYAENTLTATAGLGLPFKNYRKFNAEIKHRGNANDFKTEGSLELPLRKVKNLNFEVEHSAKSALSPEWPEFQTKAALKYNRKEYGFDVSREGNWEDLTNKGAIIYNGQRYTGEMKWRQSGSFPNVNHAGSILVTSPFDAVKSAETKFTHSINNNAYSGQLQSLVNGEDAYFDVEYTAVNEARKSVSVTMREPHPATFDANMEKTPNSFEADTTVNWDTSNRDSNVKVAVLRRVSPKYEYELKVVRPRQTSLVRTDLDYNANMFSHGATVQWGNGANKVTSYRMSGRQNQNGRNTVYSGNFELRSPFQNMEASLEHEQKSRSVKTVLEVGNVEKLTITHDFVMREPEFRDFKSDLIFKHPQLQSDIKLKFSGLFFRPRSLGGGLTKSYYTEGRINLLFANEDILLETKLGDASKPSQTKYVAWAKFAYPRADIDSQVLLEAGAQGQTLNGQLKFDHMAALDGQWKSVHLISTINQQDQTMDVEFKSPFNEDLYVRGNLVSGTESGIYNIDVTSQMGSRRMKAGLELNKNSPLMDFKLDYKPNHRFHMYAKYLSSSTAQFEAYRLISGSKTVDTQLAVRLNNSRLIHGRAYFRPQVLSEIKQYMGEDHGVQTILRELQQAARNDVDRRVRLLKVRVQPLTTFLQYLADQMDSSSSRVRTAYNAAYRRDEYYLKTSHRFLKAQYKKASDFSAAQYNKLKPMVDRHFAKMVSDWEEATARMAEQRRATHKKFVKFATESYNSVSAKSEEYKEMFNNFMSAPWFSRIGAKMTECRAKFETWMKDTIDSVRTHPYVQPVVEWSTALPESEYFIPMRNFHAQVQQHFSGVRERYSAAYDQAYAQFTEEFDTQELRRLQDWFNDLVNQGKKGYQYYGLADVENYLRTLSASNLDELKTRGLTALKNYLKLEKTRITVWDTALGDFQFEIYLPVPLRNIRDFPTDDIRRLVTRARNAMDRLRPDEDWIPWDTLYAYKVSTNPRDWVPPFKSHATLAGSQHYMTFDKTFYEYSGECSYVLAHDFIDKNFSVIVNYDTVDRRMTKKSITVLSNGKAIEIFPSFKVTVDNKQTELPFEIDDTSIIRQGNRIRLDNAKGVTVACDLAYDRCTVNVTGWYFAKTAGMLGTYNNEQYDELLTAEKRLATSPEQLADSWTVGSKCRVGNNARQHRPEDVSSARPVCAKYFQDQSSPFRLCFKQVDVAPFMTMCMNDLSERANQVVGEEDACKVAAFYVDECNRAGVALRQPRACVSCQLTDGQTFSENEDQRLQDSDVPRSADVVFVVSQKPCNRAVIPKLKKLLDALDDTLIAKRLRGNRYGVVGFGGDGIQGLPHSHTIEGQLFNRNFKVGKMIGDLAVATESSGKEAAIDALDLAARYPFRAGVSKTIVLLTCESCSENIVSYADMVELLIKRDIKLHLITPHDFRMKSNSPKANNIWGITRHTAYTSKHVGSLEGDVTLRRQTYMPKDLCGALSHETEGAIFNAKKFGDRKVKDFRTILTSVVAEAASPSECQVCECMPDETGVGQAVCHSCDMRLPLFGLLPKFDEYIEANFLDIPALSKKKSKKNLSKSKRTRRKN